LVDLIIPYFIDLINWELYAYNVQLFTQDEAKQVTNKHHGLYNRFCRQYYT